MSAPKHSDRNLILAVDGGQTSSKAIIATTTGQILGWGSGSPCDHLHGPGGYERNRDAIHSSANAALADAGVGSERIVAVGLGLTSAPRESEALPLFDRMVRELCDPDTIWVDADFVSNLAGASGGQPGVVVIAGGGSIGYGIDAHGNEAIAGGLGYLMGDEGSGWYIGLRAIQEAAKAFDLRGPDTALLPMVLEHYGIARIREVIRIIYGTSFTRDMVSTIARDVIDIARQGDLVAAEIVHTAAARLGETALGTIRQLHAPGSPVSVYPTGGIFRAGPILLDTFSRTISSDWSNAAVVEPRHPPVIGAFLKACELAGIERSEDMLSTLDQGVRKREAVQ
jgi:N-acetylglucosamine kinase-like BadF-type ATPase